MVNDALDIQSYPHSALALRVAALNGLNIILRLEGATITNTILQLFGYVCLNHQRNLSGGVKEKQE